MSRRSIPLVESLRGWAASTICFYHFIWGTVDYIHAPWLRMLSYWGQYAITLFFVVSGVVLPLALLRHQYRLRDFGRYFLRRCWRLEPPYLCSIVIVLIYLLLQAWRHGVVLELSGWNLLAHVGYWVPFTSATQEWLNPVYWSLAVEFQYYGVLGILFPIWANPQKGWRWSCYLLLLFFSQFSIQKDLVFRWLPLFLMSGNYALYSYRRINLLEFLSTLILGALVLGYTIGWAHSFVALTTLGLLHFFPSYNPQWSAWLGRCSYSLYLLHWPIGQAMVNLLSHHYRLPYQKVLVLLLGYFSSVLAAAIFYQLVELPSQQKARRIGYGHAEVPE